MKARIGGLMVLLMVVILAVSGMFWGSGTDGFDEPFQVVGKAQSLERMNIIQGTLLVNGQARNGVEATLWRAEAFDSPPAFGDPEPEDIRFRIGNPVVTGREYGGDGAYRFVSIPDGDYYVGLEVEASIAWEGHSTQRGLSTSRLRTRVHEYSRVASGQTLTLADVKGSGVVRQIFVAISSEAKSVVEDGTWLRVYVNGETNPSIACPISQFFAYTHEAEPFHSARIGTSRKSYPGDPGVDGNHSTFDRGPIGISTSRSGPRFALTWTLEQTIGCGPGRWSITKKPQSPSATGGEIGSCPIMSQRTTSRPTMPSKSST